LGLLATATPFWVIRPAYQPPPTQIERPAGVTSVRAELGNQFAILGIAARPEVVRPGETAEVTVVWRALQPGPTDYSVFVHLVSEDELIVAQADTMPGAGNRPTSQWQPDETRVETYRVTVSPMAYTPDRGYWAVGLYDHKTGARLPVRLAEAGADIRATGDALAFGTIQVIALPGDVPNPINVEFRDNVTLAGYNFSARRLRPGQSLTVTLYWRARGPVSQPYTVFAHLLDRDFGTRGGQDAVPRPPTQAWRPDQVVVGRYEFVVSPDAAPGFYQVEVGMYTLPDFYRLPVLQAAGAEGADRLLLGPLRVVAP
jgi:hypothetical protein